MTFDKRPVICLSTIDWKFLFHRPQQLMTGLARLGHPVHFRNPWQIAGNQPEQVAPNILVYRDFDQLPAQESARAIYFLYHPMYASWVEPTPDRFIIYDCLDDDPDFAVFETTMLQRANLTLCVSKELEKKFTGQSGERMLLSNGVDVAHYRTYEKEIPPELGQIKREKKALLGFSGAFYRGWVDMELVYALAASHPEWGVVIVGETYQWDFSGAPSNLVCLGPRPYGRLPAYLHQFDIGLIPFVDNQITRGADPVKLYEYAAAGIPVVSRVLPFIGELRPPLVYGYHDFPQCQAAVMTALKDAREQPRFGEEARHKFVTMHSWERQIQQLVSRLKDLTWLDEES